jgi:hypothetical protein
MLVVAELQYPIQTFLKLTLQLNLLERQLFITIATNPISIQ